MQVGKYFRKADQRGHFQLRKRRRQGNRLLELFEILEGNLLILIELVVLGLVFAAAVIGFLGVLVALAAGCVFILVCRHPAGFRPAKQRCIHQYILAKMAADRDARCTEQQRKSEEDMERPNSQWLQVCGTKVR